MQKSLKQLDVSTTKDGEILIEQNVMAADGEEVMSITIHPDQLPLLIDWLQEAAAELKNEL